MEILCSGCDTRLDVPEELSQREVRCSACGALLRNFEPLEPLPPADLIWKEATDKRTTIVRFSLRSLWRQRMLLVSGPLGGATLSSLVLIGRALGGRQIADWLFLPGTPKIVSGALMIGISLGLLSLNVLTIFAARRPTRGIIEIAERRVKWKAGLAHAVEVHSVVAFAVRGGAIVARQSHGAEIPLDGIPCSAYAAARLNLLLERPPQLGQVMYRVAANVAPLVEEHDEEESGAGLGRRKAS